MAGPYTLRDAQETDVKRLVELLLRMDAHVAGVPRATLRPTNQGLEDIRQRVRGLIDNPHVKLVVATNPRGTIVAVADLAVWHQPDFWENPERRGHVVGVIDDVWVEPAHRQRGLSRRMLAELLTSADSRGVEELSLEYAVSNEEAAALWSRLGFQATGVRASASPAAVRARLGLEESRNNGENNS